ncbi:MAG: ABC transporter ATP-binding protein [Bifidobacteriaceae bacterium]|jgi:peptide/nickel transport system ATP-binding protein|nr:ABC transporter ATP-binding protein [Bifidobacteriaceae bacterium]
MNVLELADLAVAYDTRRGRTLALDGLSLTVPPGQTVAIVGETGSGKTTAATAALGLAPPNARLVRGQVRLNAQDITGWRGKRLERVLGRDVGWIPQDPTTSLDPLKPVGWQIAEAARIHGWRDQTKLASEVTQLLERVGLDQPDRIARSYPHQLSGGQRQRALIAAAVALRPKLLVADESTSALDVTVQRRVLDLIDELRTQDGAGVLLITHDLAVAAERADQIVVLRAGLVQDSGPPAQVLGGAGSQYARQLVADAPALRPDTFRPARVSSASSSHQRLAITVDHLVKRFPGRRGRTDVLAVDNVSFDVPAGWTHGIVGESGSGKTTTARILLGLETATGGEATVAGIDLGRLGGRATRAFRRKTQMVCQNPLASLDPSMTVLAIVAEPIRRFGLASRGEARMRAADLLDRVSISSTLWKRHPRELSGGQCQRIAIARALAPGPEVLVLDEPVSALDVTVQAQVLALLAELQRDLGLTYLLISHDLTVVREIADTVTVMRKGSVEESGPVEAVFKTPSSPYTKDLLEAIPRPGRALATTSS